MKFGEQKTGKENYREAAKSGKFPKKQTNKNTQKTKMRDKALFEALFVFKNFLSSKQTGAHVVNCTLLPIFLVCLSVLFLLIGLQSDFYLSV